MNCALRTFFISSFCSHVPASNPRYACFAPFDTNSSASSSLPMPLSSMMIANSGAYWPPSSVGWTE